MSHGANFSATRQTSGGKGDENVNGAMPEDRYNAIFRKKKSVAPVASVAKKEKV